MNKVKIICQKYDSIEELKEKILKMYRDALSEEEFKKWKEWRKR